MNKKLIDAKPKLSQALLAREINFRLSLGMARQAVELEQWQVAEALGWPLKKVQDIEGITTDLKQSDLRKYLLACGLYVEYEIKSEKSL